MNWLRGKDPTMPTDVQVQLPEAVVPRQPSEYSPRYARPAAETGRREAYMRGNNAWDELENELTVIKTQLAQTVEELRQTKAEVARLQQALSEAKNDVATATTIASDAVHAANDWHGLVRNIKSMIDDFKIIHEPSSARRKRPRNGPPEEKPDEPTVSPVTIDNPGAPNV